jgi:TolB protein
MNADGSNLRNITNHPAQEQVHGWTPDGQIVFRSTRDRPQYEIYRMKPDGTDVVRMTTTIKP